ncbi:hypothetical protein QCA50_011951 [Cerrena zonata]|uniref:Uncharacterized protein n=1 Tax=Cerrena zonata TaxID=2478898 RepID=A0AAW0G0R1_9APHY
MYTLKPTPARHRGDRERGVRGEEISMVRKSESEGCMRKGNKREYAKRKEVGYKERKVVGTEKRMSKKTGMQDVLLQNGMKGSLTYIVYNEAAAEVNDEMNQVYGGDVWVCGVV